MRKIFSKKNIALLCLLCLTATLLCGVVYAAPEAEDSAGTQVRETVPLYIDGIRVGDGILMDSTTYVPLRAFCRAMGRDLHIEWDEETETMTVKLERVIGEDEDECYEVDDWPVLEPPVEGVTGLAPQKGKKATFLIRILFRQHASWQGSVTWLEGGGEQTFRSVMELIHLMDSALGGCVTPQ